MNDIHPAIFFEPDGYRTDIQKLMGRQAAGSGFLRAAVKAAAGKPLYGYAVSKASADSFAKTVTEIDPQAQPQWLQAMRGDLLGKIGHFYLPGPGLGDFARQRLRAGPAAWSITGVTHTTASHGAMESITDLMAAPVMPWDALVCTSQAVLTTVKILLGAQQEYLQWRFGAPVKTPLPQLPVIPLGVHCKDFAIDAGQRARARRALGIADDEVVALFVGRLSFHAKAHPHAMYAGLQAAARASGRKLVLVQCGWFANKTLEDAFRSGAAMACPDVRCLFTDGREEAPRRASWAAADIFISLSDNIQETFGLTPIEAMAAGLPVVVTDWDGYKDTVRDGEDGHRIRTWMPVAGAGEGLARAHEASQLTYDMYCGMSCLQVAPDHRQLAESLTALVTDPQLRARLGAAGQARAREVYDWPVIYAQYQALWAQLGRIRAEQGARIPRAPRAAPARLDPFVAFQHYPTHHITMQSRWQLQEGATLAQYEALANHFLFSFASSALPPAQRAQKVFERLGDGAASVAELKSLTGASDAESLRAVAVMAKMGLVRAAA